MSKYEEAMHTRLQGMIQKRRERASAPAKVQKEDLQVSAPEAPVLVAESAPVEVQSDGLAKKGKYKRAKS